MDRWHDKILPFNPAFPWIGGDLQTIRSNLVKKPDKPLVSRRLLVPLLDRSGSINVAVTDPAEGKNTALKGNTVLFHGLGGHEESTYLMHVTHRLVAAGYRVYRMNYRGIGPSRKTSSGPYSAGLTDDIRAVLKKVTRDCLSQADMRAAGMVPRPPDAIGFSLGGQMLLRCLGEDGARAKQYCHIAMSVSAPLDLLQSVEQIEKTRNRLYEKYLVRRMQSDLKSCANDKMKYCSTVRQIDGRIIAPHFGFADAEDYYRSVSCLAVLPMIKVPTFLLHAQDDPWIPIAPYMSDQVQKNPCLGVSLPKFGGHVGFQDSVKGHYYISDQYLNIL